MDRVKNHKIAMFVAIGVVAFALINVCWWAGARATTLENGDNLSPLTTQNNDDNFIPIGNGEFAPLSTADSGNSSAHGTVHIHTDESSKGKVTYWYLPPTEIVGPCIMCFYNHNILKIDDNNYDLQNLPLPCEREIPFNDNVVFTGGEIQRDITVTAGTTDCPMLYISFNKLSITACDNYNIVYAMADGSMVDSNYVNEQLKAGNDVDVYVKAVSNA